MMLAWYVETMIAAAVLAGACATASRWGRLGPSARHALWVVVLVKMLTPTTLVRWPAGWVNTARAAAVPVALEPRVALMDRGEIARLPAPEAPTDVELAAWRTVPAPRVAAVPPIDWAAIGVGGLVGAWALGTLIVVVRQAVGIGRFAVRVRRGSDVPVWLAESIEAAARRVGVLAPRARVVAGVETPLVWCLGRAVLVVPAELVGALPRSRWAGVLAHELAHLRRRDPLVGRLLLVGEWLWWWNPLYWWVRSRVEAEAELACDALAVAASDRGRREYAEALIDVCALRGRSARSLGSVPALGLGRGGAGRLFERRLTMIVRGGGVRESRWAGRLAVGLLALAAVPGWSLAQEEAKSEDAPPRAESRERERQERRARLQERRERMRAEMERARAEMERAQAEMRQRMEEMQARMKEDLERAEAEEGEGKDGDVLRERRPEGAELEGLEKELGGLMEELGRLGPMIQEEVTRELRGLGPELREEMKRLGPEIREEVERELGRAREEVRRARREIRVQRGGGGEDVAEQPEPPTPPEPPAPPEGPDVAGGPGMPPRPPAPPRGMMMRRIGPGGPGGMMGGPGGMGPRQQELERRIDRLEEKFDTVLEEIRAMRREMGGRDK